MEQVAIRQWGNSKGIILPKKILDALQWRQEDSLELEVIDDMLRIRKHFRHKPFEERLKAYDGKIEICDFDWGKPRGREIL